MLLLGLSSWLQCSYKRRLLLLATRVLAIESMQEECVWSVRVWWSVSHCKCFRLGALIFSPLTACSPLGSGPFVSAELPVFSDHFRHFSAIDSAVDNHQNCYILVNIWNFFIIENCYTLYNMRSLQNCNKKDDYVIYHKKSHICSWDFHINGTIFSMGVANRRDIAE